MSVKWTGSFVGWDGVTRTVNLSVDDYDGDPQELTLVAGGVNISSDDDAEDIFTPIRTQYGTISFYSTTAGELGEMMPTDAHAITCQIVAEDGTVEFDGYVKQEELSQSYTGEGTTNSISVIDKLATAGGYRIDKVGGFTIGELLQQALYAAGYSEDAIIYFPQHPVTSSGSTWIDCHVRRELFVEVDDYTGERVGLWADEVLETLLQPFGFWLSSCVGGVRINSHSEMGWYYCTLSAITDTSIRSAQAVSWAYTTPQLYGNSHSVSFFQPPAFISVTVDQPRAGENLLDDLAPDEFDYKEFNEVSQTFEEADYDYLIWRSDVNRKKTARTSLYISTAEAVSSVSVNNSVLTLEDMVGWAVDDLMESAYEEWRENYVDDTRNNFRALGCLAGTWIADLYEDRVWFGQGDIATSTESDDDAMRATAYSKQEGFIYMPMLYASYYNTQGLGDVAGTWYDTTYYQTKNYTDYTLGRRPMVLYVSDVPREFYPDESILVSMNGCTLGYSFETSEDDDFIRAVELGVLTIEDGVVTGCKSVAGTIGTEGGAAYYYATFSEKVSGYLALIITAGESSTAKQRMIFITDIQGELLTSNVIPDVSSMHSGISDSIYGGVDDERIYRQDSTIAAAGDEYEVDIVLGAGSTRPSDGQVRDESGDVVETWTDAAMGTKGELGELLLTKLSKYIDQVREVRTIDVRQSDFIQAGDWVQSDSQLWIVLAVARDYSTGVQTLTLIA